MAPFAGKDGPTVMPNVKLTMKRLGKSRLHSMAIVGGGGPRPPVWGGGRCRGRRGVGPMRSERFQKLVPSSK